MDPCHQCNQQHQQDQCMAYCCWQRGQACYHFFRELAQHLCGLLQTQGQAVSGSPTSSAYAIPLWLSSRSCHYSPAFSTHRGLGQDSDAPPASGGVLMGLPTCGTAPQDSDIHSASGEVLKSFHVTLAMEFTTRKS